MPADSQSRPTSSSSCSSRATVQSDVTSSKQVDDEENVVLTSASKKRKTSNSSASIPPRLSSSTSSSATPNKKAVTPQMLKTLETDVWRYYEYHCKLAIHLQMLRKKAADKSARKRDRDANRALIKRYQYVERRKAEIINSIKDKKEEYARLTAFLCEASTDDDNDNDIQPGTSPTVK